jgi:dienelactone hydrolase
LFVTARLTLVLTVLTASVPLAQDGLTVVGEEVTTASGRRGVIVRPAAAGRHPAVLHLHGSGDTVANNVGVLEIFARAGYVALDVEYRQNGPNSPDVEDAIESFEYLKRQRFVRADVIGVNGFSRGGRAALKLAVRGRVVAVSAIGARTSAGPSPTTLEEADRLTMPVLLQHGSEDAGPRDDFALLERRLKTLRRRVELVSYTGAGHNDLPWERVYTRVLEFFGQHLR